MPTEFGLGDLQIWTMDGVPVRLCNLADVQTFDDEDLEYTPSQLIPRDLSFTCQISGYSFRRAMQQLSYGWYAKGPIRKRVLQRLWKLGKVKRNA